MSAINQGLEGCDKSVGSFGGRGCVWFRGGASNKPTIDCRHDVDRGGVDLSLGVESHARKDVRMKNKEDLGGITERLVVVLGLLFCLEYSDVGLPGHY